jgi:hypothetical protein
LKFQEMQVDTEPFPMNMIDFEGKRVLIRPSTADKGTDKEIIIGNAREADENNKISCRKVVTEKTSDGGETLKVTITASGTGGQAQTGRQAREPMLCITNGPPSRRGRSEASPDGPKTSGGRSGYTQDPQQPRTFKPRRPEIGTWKTNTFKAASRLVKSGSTFDQLLSKYVKKMAGPNDRPAKRPRSPIHEQHQVRPIGPPHQSEEMKGHMVQLRPNIPTWTPPPPYPPMPYPYTYLPPPYVPNQMWGMPPYPFGMPQYPAWGAPQTSVFNRLAPPVQDRLSVAQSSHQTQTQQDCRSARSQRPTNPAGGHIPAATKRTTKKDIIKIDTTDVIIQEDSEGPMIWGESANTTKKEDTATIKTADPKYSMPRWCPAGLTRSQKRKLQRLRAKDNQEKEAKKIFNDTHPQYPPSQKKWRPKAVEEKQTATKIENKTALVQHPAGMADSPAKKAGPATEGADYPTPESGPSAPHHDASDNVPTSMEEDDLLGEDLVDYEASLERPGMDVNVITFSADCTIVGDDELVVAQFDFGPKEAVFTKPKESVNHLKPLFVRGHIDGIPIAKMLVDGGAAVNLISYSLYRKLGKQDDELVKTNMTLSGVGTDSSIKARGVTSVELTIGTKTLAVAFFVADVEGNYSLILGRDWIHANQYIPSTLYQMLIQWVGDDIEQVHADVSACITVADAPVL